MNIFIFHRDFRLIDNTTLLKIKNSVPIFIFTPEQIDNNSYFSSNSFQFMIESLYELEKLIKKKSGELYFFKGDNIKVLDSILQNNKINSISYNIDYTPYARKRDLAINTWAQDNNIQICCEEDYPLHNIMEGETKNQTSDNAYLVFTPFKKHCEKLQVRKPSKYNKFTFQKIDFKDNKYKILLDHFKYIENENINVRGGRKNGLKILKNIIKWKDYAKERDYLSYKTTYLSSHNHFGTVSIREVYNKLLGNDMLINELYWRDFYINITYYYPKILEGQIGKKNKSLKEKYDTIKWSTKHFDSWCNGQTGFPIIDAAMNQLNITGYMHNRCRMIVASFLTKDLLLDWRLGEKYFATKLVDYDPMSNSGGWQWSASVGADSQPYFRIFNPFSQQKKFDKDCKYIKNWLPILESVPAKDIHLWDITCKKYIKDGIKYYEPIIDHSIQRKKALKLFSDI